MKTIILNIAMVFGVLIAKTGFAQEVVNGPQLTFTKETHDFGKVAYGGNTVYNFEFRNTGKEALLISYVSSPCGCTVADWPKESIAPGAQGKISVKYDSKRPGPINKSVSVRSNSVTMPDRSLTIKGEILPMKEEAAAVPASVR